MNRSTDSAALTGDDSSLSAPALDRAWGLSPRWLLFVIIAVPLLATLWWWLGVRYLESQLTWLEYQQFAAVLAVAVAGGYQLYFWVQRNGWHRSAVCLEIGFDRYIPFQPAWIWPYSLLYYIGMGLTVMSITSIGQGIHLIFGGILLLVAGCGIFYFLPTRVPDQYRDFEIVGLSTRYLAFVQSMDNERNAFPSMHCALAAYVGLALGEMPLIGDWVALVYIGVIAVSCVLVKQHVIVDTVAGVALGAGAYHFNQSLLDWFA